MRTRQEMIASAERWRQDANRAESFHPRGTFRKYIFKVDNGNDLDNVKNSLINDGFLELFMGIDSSGHFSPFLQLGKDNDPDSIPGKKLDGSQLLLVDLEHVNTIRTVQRSNRASVDLFDAEEASEQSFIDKGLKGFDLKELVIYRNDKFEEDPFKSFNLPFGSTSTQFEYVFRFQSIWRLLKESEFSSTLIVPDIDPDQDDPAYNIVKGFGCDPIVNLMSGEFQWTQDDYNLAINYIEGIGFSLGATFDGTLLGRCNLSPILIIKFDNRGNAMRDLTNNDESDWVYYFEQLATPCPPTCS